MALSKSLLALVFGVQLALLTALSGPAWAWGDSDWGYSYDYLEDSIQSDMIWRSMKVYQDSIGFGKTSTKSKPSAKTPKAKAATAKPKPQPKPPAKPAFDPNAFRYKYSPQVSQEVKAQMIDRIVAQATSENRAALRKELQQIDMAGTVRTVLKQQGYEPDSVASATTYFILSNYGIAHGTESTDAQNRAVLKQFEQAFGSMSSMRGTSDAQKQKSAELLYWFATLQHVQWKSVSGNAQARATAAAQAREAVKSLGVDFDKLAVTNQGLQAKTNL